MQIFREKNVKYMHFANSTLQKCPHRDSNPNLRLRRSLFYPIELWERATGYFSTRTARMAISNAFVSDMSLRVYCSTSGTSIS